MKVYKTQSEIEADIKDNVLVIRGDVKFECSFCIDAHIVVIDGDINASDIIAWNITARDIFARSIDARDINSWNISALNINARNIGYYAYAIAYTSFRCKSIVGKRENAKHICLDNDIVIGE